MKPVISKSYGHCYLCYADIEPKDKYFSTSINEKWVRICSVCEKKGEKSIGETIQKRILEWSLRDRMSDDSSET